MGSLAVWNDMEAKKAGGIKYNFVEFAFDLLNLIRLLRSEYTTSFDGVPVVALDFDKSYTGHYTALLIAWFSCKNPLVAQLLVRGLYHLFKVDYDVNETDIMPHVQRLPSNSRIDEDGRIKWYDTDARVLGRTSKVIAYACSRPPRSNAEFKDSEPDPHRDISFAITASGSFYRFNESQVPDKFMAYMRTLDAKVCVHTPMSGAY